MKKVLEGAPERTAAAVKAGRTTEPVGTKIAVVSVAALVVTALCVGEKAGSKLKCEQVASKAAARVTACPSVFAWAMAKLASRVLAPEIPPAARATGSVVFVTAGNTVQLVLLDGY